QFLAKFRRKQRLLTGENADRFAAAAGVEPDAFLTQLQSWRPAQLRDWLALHPHAADVLDRSANLDPARVLISTHADELRRVERGYGTGTRPADYLESFRAFVAANLDRIPALLVVTQRPRELTRQQLRELKLALDEAGFTE